MAVDLNQVSNYRAQLQQLEAQQHLQQASLTTQQSALALEACKYIINLERTEDDVAQFSDDVIRASYETVERISVVFAPHIQPLPKADA